MDAIIENKTYQKHHLSQADLIGVLHLFHTGVSIARPHYEIMSEGIKIEIGFKNDQRGGLAIFDKIFKEQYDFNTSSGLSRTFVFMNENEYNAFFAELANILLIGNYIANSKNDFCERIYQEYKRTR
jgi:hypothetical protein